MSWTRVAGLCAYTLHLFSLSLIRAPDIALPPRSGSSVLPLHIYGRSHCLPRRHSQTQEAWHPPRYVSSPPFLPINSPSPSLPSTIASICASNTLPPCFRVDPHGHHVGSYAAHGPEADSEQNPTSGDGSDLEKVTKSSDVGHAHHGVDTRMEKSFQNDVDAMAQLIGVGILEFGVVLHRHVFVHVPSFPHQITEPVFFSVLIGLTLAVDDRFKVLFVVIIFHRMYPPSTPTISLTDVPSQKRSKALALVRDWRTSSFPRSTATFHTSAHSSTASRHP